MKPATALVLSLAATGAVAYFVLRKPKALGAGGHSSEVKGPVSGQIYAVGIGETGPGGTLFSVFDPTDPSMLLFTYAETQGNGRALLAQNPDAPPEHLRTGLQDFGLSNA